MNGGVFMSQEVKKFNYTTGIFDVVCRDIRMKIKERKG